MQEGSSTAGAIAGMLPIILMSLFIAVSANLLAKEKGRNVIKWTILGAIPIVNFVCIWFFVGAANLKLERKLDELAARLDAISTRP
jgi:O-antigen/teichoic acid export membrane protein